MSEKPPTAWDNSESSSNSNSDDSDWDCIQEENIEDFKARQLEKQKQEKSNCGYSDIGIEAVLSSPCPAAASPAAAGTKAGNTSRLVDKINKELERRGGSYLPCGRDSQLGIDDLDGGDGGGVGARRQKRDASEAAAFGDDEVENAALSEFGQQVFKRMRLAEEAAEARFRDRRLLDVDDYAKDSRVTESSNVEEAKKQQQQQALAEELKAKREALVAALKSDFGQSSGSRSASVGDSTILPGTRLRLTRLRVSSLDWEQRLMRGRRLVAIATSGELLSRQLEQCRTDSVQAVLVGVLVAAIQQQKPSGGGGSGGGRSSYSIWRLADLDRLGQQPVGLFLFGKVHEAHWKEASTGLAVAVLQPRVMPSRPGGSGGVSLAIDNPQQLLVLGKAADYGVCGRPTKSGNGGGRCQNAVNLAACQVCEYHAGQEYRRLASKRSDVASTFVGVEPRKYREPHQPSAVAAAKPLGVTFLKSGSSNSLAQQSGSAISAQISRSDVGSGGGIKSFLQQQGSSALNSPGARMLRRSLEVTAAAAKLQQGQNSAKAAAAASLPFSGASRVGMPDPSSGTNLSFSSFAAGMNRDFRPQLGRGSVGDVVELGDDSVISTSSAEKPAPNVGPSLPKPTVMTVGEIAKLRAIRKMRAAGGMQQLQQQQTERRQAELSQRLEDTDADAAVGDQPDAPSTAPKRHRLLGNVDTESPEFQRLLSQSSAYADLASQRVSDEQDRYFNTLERREQVEAKLATISERKVRVADCVECGVRCQQPSERCKREGHQLNWTSAVKRPFKCKDCKQNTFTLDCRYPTEPCRRCGGQSFEKTSFAPERKGPTLEREVLLARGEERKFVGQ